MVWFKNAIIYEFDNEMLFDTGKLNDALLSFVYTPCLPSQMTSIGWIPPFLNIDENETKMLFFATKCHILLKIRKETKVIPPAVIKKILSEKIIDQQTALQRKLSRSEVASIKETVILELSMRAFSRYRDTLVWIDLNAKRCIVDTASIKYAEDVINQLRNGLGALSFKLLHSQDLVEKRMTNWLKNPAVLNDLCLGDEVELIDAQETSSYVACKRCDIGSDEILAYLDSNRLVSKVMLINEGHQHFVLNRDLTLKRIKFSSELMDTHNDFAQDEQDHKSQLDFLIMAESLSETIDKIKSLFNE